MNVARITGLAVAATGLMTLTAHADPRLPHYNKVVIVVEENEQQATIIGNPSAPYTNVLARNGALFRNSYGCEHPSQPNYLDIFSGEDQNVYNDGPVPVNLMSGDNLGAELLHHGDTFIGYSEDLPYMGDTTDQFAADPNDPLGPSTHDYARKHNPWANWQNDAFPASVANQGSNYLPSWVNQTFDPYAAITKTGNFQDLPTVSIVIPNQQHDDHGVPGGLSGDALIAAGDQWLEQYIKPYAKWAVDHNSLLIVTFDEDDFTSTNKIATIFYGAHVKKGRFSEKTISFTSLINSDGRPSGAPQYAPVIGVNHWNVLRTVEDIYGLAPTGQAAKVAPITDIFGG